MLLFRYGPFQNVYELLTQTLQIVLAADTLYDDNHPSLLATTISHHLSHDPLARAVVMVPIRDSTATNLLTKFKHLMFQADPTLICSSEEDIVGQDDWGGGEAGEAVKCWLGVFRPET
jgi:hypothetical protein